MLERACLVRTDTGSHGARPRAARRSREVAVPDEIHGARQHLLRAGARRRRTDSERSQIFSRRFRAAHRREALPLEDVMAKIWVDGSTYEADAKQNLLHACLSLGFDLPYFCWHPALGSVGACRQCAVKQFKDEADQKGKLVMACMTPASEGSRISIQDPDAVEFR